VEEAARLTAHHAFDVAVKGNPSAPDLAEGDVREVQLLASDPWTGIPGPVAVRLTRRVGKLYALCASCGSRCRALYLPRGEDARAKAKPGEWACMTCHTLAYRSTQERRRWDALDKLAGVPLGTFEHMAALERERDPIRPPLPK
jgi:hypothetical protein